MRATAPVLLCVLSLPLIAIPAPPARAQTPASCVKLSSAVSAAPPDANATSGQTARPDAGIPVAPGTEEVISITVTNVCSQPAKDLVVDRPVPERMTYIKGTAKGDGTDRIFSVDGKSFARFDDLRVAGKDGTPRPGGAEDIKVIRWKFNVPLDPGQSAEIHFHVHAL